MAAAVPVVEGADDRDAAAIGGGSDDSEDDAKSNATTIRLREKGTDKVHIFEAWAWESDAPEDKPDWMEGKITKGNVSKQGIEHLEE